MAVITTFCCSGLCHALFSILLPLQFLSFTQFKCRTILHLSELNAYSTCICYFVIYRMSTRFWIQLKNCQRTKRICLRIWAKMVKNYMFEYSFVCLKPPNILHRETCHNIRRIGTFLCYKHIYCIYMYCFVHWQCFTQQMSQFCCAIYIDISCLCITMLPMYDRRKLPMSRRYQLYFHYFVPW